MKVLFVCLGNICRSPTAAGVFDALLRSEAPDLAAEVDSAGTHAYHIGEPPDRRSCAAAGARGVDLSRMRARQVSREDFYRFDFILAMDKSNLEDLRRLAPNDASATVALFLSYAPGAGDEVPDPYYGGDNGFERVLDLVEEAGRGLLGTLFTRPD